MWLDEKNQELVGVVENPGIVERPVSEILKLAGKATRKEYFVVRGKEGAWTSAWVKTRALVGETWHVGERHFHGCYEGFGLREDGVRLDEEGHPYQIGEYGTEKFRRYHKLFLGNTSWATAMAQGHDSLIRQVRRAIKRDKRHAWIIERFNRWKSDVERRQRGLKRAKLLADYRIDKRELPNYGGEDRDIEELRRGTEPFDYWYVGFIEKTYRKKIKLTEKARASAFGRWVQKFTDRLEGAGFRPVKKRTRGS